MKRFFALALLLGLLLGTAACSGDREAESIPASGQKGAAASPSPASGPIFRTVPPREAQAMIASRPELLVVDLREPGEMKEGYIDGSIMIPVSDLSKGTKSLPANQPLLLVCAVGGRSYGVGRYFSLKGYREIYNLQGGIDDWKKAGLPLKY
jgi:rhodanese-related sulfurtransferase